MTLVATNLGDMNCLRMKANLSLFTRNKLIYKAEAGIKGKGIATAKKKFINARSVSITNANTTIDIQTNGNQLKI